jgi:hypothetical protein
MAMRNYVLFLAVIATACSSAAGAPSGLALSVDAPAVSAADTIDATLVNSTGATVFYQECSVALEVRAGGDWELVGPDPCASIANPVLMLVRVDANATSSVRYGIPAGTDPGTYRLTLRLVEPTIAEVGSNRFVVQPE